MAMILLNDRFPRKGNQGPRQQADEYSLPAPETCGWRLRRPPGLRERRNKQFRPAMHRFLVPSTQYRVAGDGSAQPRTGIRYCKRLRKKNHGSDAATPGPGPAHVGTAALGCPEQSSVAPNRNPTQILFLLTRPYHPDRIALVQCPNRVTTTTSCSDPNLKADLRLACPLCQAASRVSAPCPKPGRWRRTQYPATSRA